MNKIIAVNAGSSTVKFKIYMQSDFRVVASGLVERIGSNSAGYILEYEDKKYNDEVKSTNHEEAVALILNSLLEKKILLDYQEIVAIGHRVVHGGEYFKESVLVTEDAIQKVKSLEKLAPLHNPANLIGYYSFKKSVPHAKHAFVFDTAFHQTMISENYLYALPLSYYKDYKIRRYGFHGTSHYYVSQRLSTVSKAQKVITCHLGNGASLAAISKGKVINTSMGFTPLSGLVMGTRTGDLDPAIIPFLMQELDISAQETIDIFNKKSGLLGISELSNDMREINKAIANGNQNAELAKRIYCNRISEYIGNYFIQLQGLNAIVFTAGVGENDIDTLSRVLNKIAPALNIKYDFKLNDSHSEIKISTSDSAVEVWIIPTNEELVIAQDTAKVIL